MKEIEVMKEITLKIPDKKLQFFMELFEQLGVQATQQIDIPESQKKIVRQRIEKSNPEELVPWNEARKKLTYK